MEKRKKESRKRRNFRRQRRFPAGAAVAVTPAGLRGGGSSVKPGKLRRMLSDEDVAGAVGGAQGAFGLPGPGGELR